MAENLVTRLLQLDLNTRTKLPKYGTGTMTILGALAEDWGSVPSVTPDASQPLVSPVLMHSPGLRVRLNVCGVQAYTQVHMPTNKQMNLEKQHPKSSMFSIKKFFKNICLWGWSLERLLSS